jgi:hypothetical protein
MSALPIRGTPMGGEFNKDYHGACGRVQAETGANPEKEVETMKKEKDGAILVKSRPRLRTSW